MYEIHHTEKSGQMLSLPQERADGSAGTAPRILRGEPEMVGEIRTYGVSLREQVPQERRKCRAPECRGMPGGTEIGTAQGHGVLRMDGDTVPGGIRTELS